MLTSKITGQTMVFKNDRGFYSTSIGAKSIDGGYKNAYITLQFKKGTDIENKTQINIKNGFLTFDKYMPKDGTNEVTSWKIVVTDFEVLSKDKAISNDKTNPNSDFEIINEDDIPF